MASLFKLQLFLHDGTCLECLGTEEVLSTSLTEIQTLMSNPPVDQDQDFGSSNSQSEDRLVVKVDGFWDSADKAETTTLVRVTALAAVRLFRMSYQ